ncbi:flavin reductase family protein [Arthrobacter sp. Leaf337]|uniref:flavin reductase family protein n=1 Tax=Arthrobacter sp. Leaf337 TaxID=1736342 RepID=UPI001F4545DE|nr:flavin reductase family protein [Arthrobacter sp. Leaf337]
MVAARHNRHSTPPRPAESPRGNSRDRTISAASFRKAMAHVATPVSVVTTVSAGSAFGTTVSAFLSLSMQPPMVLISLDAGSNLLAALKPGSPLGVNVLGEGQGSIARHFATKSKDKFEGIVWQPEAGAPRLPDLHVWIAGRVAEITPAGDHMLVLVNVEETDAGRGSPLTYWSGVFGTHYGDKN